MNDNTHRDKLMADLKLVVADAEALLQATTGQAGVEVAELRERVKDTLKAARHSLADAQEAVVERAKATAKATDEYVHDHPWKAVGIAAGIGLLVGVIIGRR